MDNGVSCVFATSPTHEIKGEYLKHETEGSPETDYRSWVDIFVVGQICVPLFLSPCILGNISTDQCLVR